ALAGASADALARAAPRLHEQAIAGGRATRHALRRLQRRHAQAGALPGTMQPIHGDLALSNVVLTASDLHFTGVARPLAGASRGMLGLPLSDLADLLHSLAMTLAQLAAKHPGAAALAHSLASRQQREFRRALLHAYARHGGTLPDDAAATRRALRLLQ